VVAGAGRTLLADVKGREVAMPLAHALRAAGFGARTIVSGDLAHVDIVGRLCGAARAWTLPARSGTAPPPASGPWGLATPAARRRVTQAAVLALSRGDCDAVSVDRRFVDADLSPSVHRAGGRLIVWTVDDPSELRRFDGLGTDAVVTNDPAAARRALAARITAVPP
jgi:glycerophosphoryl diester phosphodiesterase